MIKAREPLDADVDRGSAANRPDLAPLAVDAAGSAALCSVSVRHWWALHSSGRCPMPIRVGGRAVRWRVSELDAWLAAGAPSRDAWQAMRDTTT